MRCIAGTAGEDCGRRDCLKCGPDARSVAVALEQTVNQAEPTDPASSSSPTADPAPVSAKVEMAVFGRSVLVEANESLKAVSEVAAALWQQLADAPVPVGATGFVMDDPPGPAPLEMAARGLDPFIRVRAPGRLGRAA